MKTPLLLLHGAIGASRQMKTIAEKLAANYEVHLFDLPGHGGKELSDELFSIKLFADAALNYIQKNNLQQLTIFGYSMGGYVAMYLAKHYPQAVDKIVTLGTKFHWDEATAAKEVKMLNADIIAEKVPAFAAALEEMHSSNNWKDIVHHTAAMLVEMGRDNPLKTEDYKEIKHTSLIMLGDRDKMVTLEETVAVYKNLPNAQMAILPGTPHPIEQVDAAVVAFFLSLQL